MISAYDCQPRWKGCRIKRQLDCIGSILIDLAAADGAGSRGIALVLV